MAPRLACLAFCAIAGATFAASGMAAAETNGAITVEDAWSRAVPEGGRVAAGYLTIKNAADEPDRLVSASTAIAAETEIHQMSMSDGVMRMRPVPDGVTLPAKSTVKLEPNGYHFMLTGLRGPLKQGDSFPATLTFERGGSVEVTFHVLGMGAQGPGAKP